MEYKWKWISIGTVGSLFALSHIGMIGMLAQRGNNFPKVNLPVGEYTSYTVEAGEKGYRINYRANDPLVMEVTKEVNKPGGFLGLSRAKMRTRELYTMEGSKHLDGGGSSGKLSAANIACIKAEGSGEGTGRMVGGSLGAAASPSLIGIPFVGWVLAGAATMIGMDAGAEVGGEMAKSFADCDPDIDSKEQSV